MFPKVSFLSKVPSYLILDLFDEWSHILTIFLSPCHEILYIYFHSPLTFLRSRLCILSSNNTPLIYWWNCYPWYSICSRRSPTHQHCFNSFSSYRTSISLKLVGLVPEFYGLIYIQNLAAFVLYPGRYIRISGAIRICKLCWPSYLHYFISRAMDLRLR
jgi:hypothetical protein